MAGYDNDYVAHVLKEIAEGLLARPKRVNWDLVGDLATTLAVQNEEREYGPRYGELPARLLNAYNSGKPNHLAAALSTAGWHCWADVETLAGDAGARVRDTSSVWKIDYTAVVRSLRWKRGMRDVVWQGHENRNYARCEFMWPSGYRVSGAKAFNSRTTRSILTMVQWDTVLTPYIEELERAFKWYGFPREFGRFSRDGFYDHKWQWGPEATEGWLHALDLYYFLPYICKGAALVMQAAKEAAELLEPSRGLVRRGDV